MHQPEFAGARVAVSIALHNQEQSVHIVAMPISNSVQHLDEPAPVSSPGQLAASITRPPHPDDFLGYRLWHVHHAWQRYLENALGPLGLTHVQFVLLLTVAWFEGQSQQPSQADLIAFTHFEKMMVSRVLRSLQERGFIARSPHPDDPRANRIALTEVGREAFEAALPVLTAAQERFFAFLGERREAFAAELGRIMTSHDLT